MSLIQSSGINQQSIGMVNQVSTSTQLGMVVYQLKSTSQVKSTYLLLSIVFGSWIINSGASDHICASLKSFQSFNEIKPISIRLPNGQFSIAKYLGTVILAPDFCIKTVFCYKLHCLIQRFNLSHSGPEVLEDDWFC